MRARLGRLPRAHLSGRRPQRRVAAAARSRSPARPCRRPQPRPGGHHRAGPAGAQLRASGPAAGGAAGTWLRGAFPRSPHEPGSARPAAAADPRRGRGARAHADHRAHAAWPPAQVGGGTDAALDQGAFRLSGGSGSPARPGRCPHRRSRGGHRARDVRLVCGRSPQLLLAGTPAGAARHPDVDGSGPLEPGQHPRPADQPGLRRPARSTATAGIAAARWSGARRRRRASGPP
jgi:hypothetical protein